MIEEREIITDLEQLSVRAEEINPKEEGDRVKNIILDMKALIRKNDLRGLAAPQIGENVRIVLVNFKNDIKAYVDPQPLAVKGLAPVIETDPSLPGKRYLLPRYFHLDLRALTPNGLIENFCLEGQAAYVMQQLLDHLEGILISDYGLEITEVFDEMSAEDKEDLIREYMLSLKDAEVVINEQVEQDETLKEIRDGMRFLESVQKGETQIEFEELTEEEKKQLEEDATAEDDIEGCEVHDSEEGEEDE